MNRATVTSIAGAIIVVLGAILLAGSCDGADDSTGGASGTMSAIDPDCLEVPAAVSSEKVTLLTELAEDFNDTDPEVDGQCVGITIYRVASDGATSLLAAGWPQDQTDVPPPVL